MKIWIVKVQIEDSWGEGLVHEGDTYETISYHLSEAGADQEAERVMRSILADKIESVILTKAVNSSEYDPDSLLKEIDSHNSNVADDLRVKMANPSFNKDQIWSVLREILQEREYLIPDVITQGVEVLP